MSNTKTTERICPCCGAACGYNGSYCVALRKMREAEKAGRTLTAAQAIEAARA
jgi:hypothetical protein